MPSQNSVLFDFSSLVDIEMSLFKCIIDNPDIARSLDDVIDMDKYNVCRTSPIVEEKLRMDRCQNVRGLLREFLKPLPLNEYLSLRDALYQSLQNFMFGKNDYISFTNVVRLIGAYAKAGHDVIKTSIVCSREEKIFLLNYFNTNFIHDNLEDIKMDDNFSRVISGDFRNLLRIDYGGPKSIIVLNYRENFLEQDSTILRPELVITLGDIHDIKVMHAYNLFTMNI